MQQNLFLLTAQFPFGIGETFLETEIHYLAESFSTVYIIPTEEYDRKTCRTLPDNCTIKEIDLKMDRIRKAKSLLGLFSKEYRIERKIVRDQYKTPFSSGIRNTMLVSLYRAKLIRSFIEGLGAQKSSILYSYWCDDAALGLALYKEHHPDSKVVCRAHGWDIYFETSAIDYLPFRKLISGSLDRIYPVSQRGRTYIIDKWNCIDQDKICVSKLGVREQVLNPKTSDQLRIVSCSNLIPLKRVDLIVKALALIEDLPVSWTHFGDGIERVKIKGLAEQGLPPNIRVDIKGRIPNKEVLLWYRQNNPDIFINVSSSEGIPVSIMEAMSFGIPVIATNVGGNAEIVNNSNGILLSADPEPEGIAGAIRQLMNDPVSRKEKGEKAYETWKEEYNAATNYLSFVDHLKKL